MAAALANPRAEEEFDDFLIRSGGNPVGADVAREWGFAGAGARKRVLLRSMLGRWADSGGDGVAVAAANACLCSFVIGDKARPKAAWFSDMAESIREGMGAGWSPAEAARAACGLGLAKAATNVRTAAEVRDFIFQGYGVFYGCAWVGYDDRPETVSTYGQAMVMALGPDGFRWEPASTIDRGIAVSGVLGWPRRR